MVAVLTRNCQQIQVQSIKIYWTNLLFPTISTKSLHSSAVFSCAHKTTQPKISLYKTQIFHQVPQNTSFGGKLKSREKSEIKLQRARKSKEIFLMMARVAVHVDQRGNTGQLSCDVTACCKICSGQPHIYIYSNQSFILYLFSGTCCRPRMVFVGGWGAKILRSSINIPFCVGVEQPIQKANRAK